METGKRICQALKNLRKRIADANEIPFEIEECTHKGDCPGTCPKCESELRYLMESINQREQEGKPVVVDGLMSEAELHQAFDIKPICPESPQEPKEFVLQGMPVPPSDTMRLMGDIAAPSNSDFAAIIARELLAKTEGNIVFSPVGLCRMLEMLQEGMMLGMEPTDLWFDPLFLVVKGMQDKQMEVLEAINSSGFNDF